ncbi:hypothetical protein AQJ91_14980 [Streptomyces dysideae]|uniref:Tetratricopeptide repeat protein n=1 Tax=Streptomyces dysideae TaxID=909626 RepID=A0A117S168_9ACTN|nr:hypothetical protein AQJ91_14980 [Streptomyces dysideae]
MYTAGEYEETEAEAWAFAAALPQRPRGRHLFLGWCARTLATAAAISHGRSADVLPELETLIAELEPAPGNARLLWLEARTSRVVILADQHRYTEAEAEALDILRAITRLPHLTGVWKTELCVLGNLAHVLRRQGRHEEAEAIARGNLPRAEGRMAAAMHCVLVDSMNGQGRYEEALAEAHRLTPTWVRAGSGALDMAIATALHGLNRPSEAEASARQALTACERFLHPAHPRIREARTLLDRIASEDPGM